MGSGALVEASTTHFQEVGFWRTANVFYYVRRGGKRALSADSIHSADESACHRVSHSRFHRTDSSRTTYRIDVFFSVVAAEQTVFESKIITHQQAGVGVMLNVFGVDFVVFDQVAQNARQERNVRTGTNRRKYPPQKRYA